MLALMTLNQRYRQQTPLRPHQQPQQPQQPQQHRPLRLSFQAA